MSKLNTGQNVGYTKSKNDSIPENYPNTIVEAVYWDEKKKPLNEVLSDSASKTEELEEKKLNAPVAAGSAGQVLALDANGKPAWVNAATGGIYDGALSDSSTNAPQNKVVTAELTALGQEVDEIYPAFEKSANLLDLSAITEGIKFSPTNGNPTADSTQNGTDYIKVEPGVTYECQSKQGSVTQTRTVRWYAYDENKGFISGSFASANTYTIPAGGHYIRVAYPNTSICTEWMIAVGSAATTYVEFYGRIKASYLPLDVAYNINSDNPVKNKTIADTILNGNGYGDHSIPAGAMSIMVPDKNKLNLSDKDFIYGKVITASGTTDNANGFASGYIPVTSGQRFAFYANTTEAAINAGLFACRWNAYDAGGSPLAGAYVLESTYYDVPSGAKFIRVGFVYTLAPYKWMVVVDEGKSTIKYEGFRLVVSTSFLPDDSLLIWKNAIALPTIKAFSGLPINIYYGNIINYFKDDIYFSQKTVKGTLTKKKWTYTPSASESLSIPFEYLDHAYRELNNDNISVNVVASSVKASLKVLVIGDSTVNLATSLPSGGETGKMLALASVDNYPLTLLGTRGTGANQHEGRGGWTAKMMCTQASAGSTPNAFWNPNTSKFDFSYYMTQQGYSGVDCVFLQFGINDMTSYDGSLILDDATAALAISQMFTYMDEMIESIHAYDSSIKIVVNLTIPCSHDQDKALQAPRQPWWRHKRNTYLLNVASLTHYSAMSNVLVSPFNAAIDVDNFSDEFHPNQDGFDELGTQMYSFMRAIN